MDIHIEAPHHDNQESLANFYRRSLEKAFGKYTFVKQVELKTKPMNNAYFVSVRIEPEKGKIIYASDEHVIEDKAYKNVLNKINVMIEKYKQNHYHTHDRPNKY